MNARDFLAARLDSVLNVSTQHEHAVRGLFAHVAPLVAACAPAALGQGCQPDWWPGATFQGISGSVHAAAEWDPDGPGGLPPRYVIGGQFVLELDGGGRNVAIWDPTNNSWESFGDGVSSTVNAIAVMQDDSLVVGGAFTTAGGVSANHIARWNGSAWEPLGAGVDNTVFALQVLPDGELAVGGSFSNAGGVPAKKIARWDGSAWRAYGAGFTNTGSVYALALHNGELLAGGSFQVNATRLARWDGTAWQSFAGGTAFAVRHLSHAASADLIAAGDQTPGTPVANIVRYDGTSWHPIGARSQTDNTVYSVAELPNGDIVAAGDFTEVDGVPASRLARWDGSSWSEFAGGASNTAFAAKLLTDSRLAVGGNAPLVRELGRCGMALWDGNAWASPNNQPGFNGSIYAAERMRNGDIVVGGDFTITPSGSANHIARWSGTRWDPLGDGVMDLQDGFTVVAIAELPNGDIIAGGEFDVAGGIPANNIARWDGATWHAMGDGIHPTSNFSQSLPRPVEDLIVLPNGDLIAGGAFDAAGGTPAANVARWDGNSWTSLGAGIDPGSSFRYVNALAHMPSGDLIAAGVFSFAGGSPAKQIARWDGNAWYPLGTGVSAQVSALAVLPNGDLAVGGQFKTAGGVAVNRLARWDGSTWSDLGGGVTGTSTIWVMAFDVLPNGTLVVGGSFAAAGGVGASNIAAWDGMSWTALGSGTGDWVEAIAHRTSTDLFVGGQFLKAGGHDSAYLARWGCNCEADFNADGFVNGNDYDEFATLFDAADPGADFNGDGFVNGDDYDGFASHFDAGC